MSVGSNPTGILSIPKKIIQSIQCYNYMFNTVADNRKDDGEAYSPKKNMLMLLERCQ